jgi:hypothetical protein
MIPAGQTEIEPNTPYARQVGDIATSYGKSNVDLTNTVNSENYDRYNTSLYNAVNSANNGTITQDVFDGWLNNPDTRPAVLANYFQPAPQLIAF